MDELIRPLTDEHLAYLRDESRRVGEAQSISFPKTEADIQAILATCYKDDIPVTVQGARTGLAGAASPNGGHIMSLNRMNRVLGCRYDGEMFYLRVQPGVALCELRKMITSRRFDTKDWSQKSLDALTALSRAPEQFFPPDPTETTASIGGIASCNASGARSYKYKAARGYIHELTLILMDGRTIHLKRGKHHAQGRKLTLQPDRGEPIHVNLPTYQMPKTKNTSAYYADDNMDAIDLIIGSDGTLGVISEMELSLLPLPDFIYGVLCLFPSQDQSVSFVQRLRACDEGVASMEFFDAYALDVLRTQRQTHAAFSGLPVLAPWINAAIYVELRGNSEDEMLTRLAAIGNAMETVGSDSNNTWVARNGSELDKLLFFRHAVPESVNLLIDKRKQKNPGITKLGSDMAVSDEHLRHIMDYYTKSVKDYGLQSATWGHIGNNHLHVNILPNDMEEYRLGKQLFLEFAATVTSLNGSVSAEHGVGKLKADFLPIMYTKEHMEQMKKVKAQFDPKGLLGVGNMFEAHREVEKS